MRLLVFGGSFNPPHCGHVQLIEFLLKAEQPDLLLVLPVAQAPHKNPADFLPFTARLYLTRIQLSNLLKKYRSLKVSRLENHLPAPSYTIRTIEYLQSCLPQARITLVLGADAFAALDTWYEPARLAALVEFLVLRRSDTCKEVVPQIPGAELRYRFCNNPLWEVSSSLLRDWLHDYYLAVEQQDYYLQEWVASLLREKLGSQVLEQILRHRWYRKPDGYLA